MNFVENYRHSHQQRPTSGTQSRPSTARLCHCVGTAARSLLLSTLLLIGAPCAVAADVECTERPECWPEGSAMHTGLLRRQIEDKLRKQLQQRHEELVALISTKHVNNGTEHLDDQRLVEAVQAQHKSWHQFKDNECELIGALSGGMSTWQSARAVECEMNLTSQRLKRMQHAIRCVKRIAPEDRQFNQQACLYQLAPLAVPLEK
jgi:uncharacterized protein YecT (DUF1311 family)